MTTRNLWFIVVGVAILAALLITKMFQPSGVVIPYDAASYFEVRKLFFAAGVLAVLGFMLILSIAVYMSLSQSNPAISAGKDIFDSMVKVVPPIITLVLGYYFGQQSAVKTITDPATIQVNKEAIYLYNIFSYTWLTFKILVASTCQFTKKSYLCSPF